VNEERIAERRRFSFSFPRKRPAKHQRLGRPERGKAEAATSERAFRLDARGTNAIMRNARARARADKARASSRFTRVRVYNFL